MEMQTFLTIGFIGALTLYGWATMLYCLRVIFDYRRFAFWGLVMTLGAFILHTASFSYHAYDIGYPFFLSSFESWQVISGGLIFVFLLLSLFYRFIAAGILIVPLAMVFYILSLTHIVSYRAPNHLLANPWAFIHLVFIFLGVLIFLVSMVTGLLYLIREGRIKQKLTGGFWDRLPSLEIMEQLHYRSLYIGFVCFTIGMITGGGWSKTINGVYLTGDLKQIISLAVWIFFAVFLNLKLARGWVGRRGIVFSGVGFAGIILLLTLVHT